MNSILPTSFVPSYLATSPPLPPNANPAVLEAAHPTQIAGYSVEKVFSIEKERSTSQQSNKIVQVKR